VKIPGRNLFTNKPFKGGMAVDVSRALKSK
jgi:hypothetical protein